MFGYRHGEVSIPAGKLEPTKTKQEIKFTGCNIHQYQEMERRPISRTLPIYFTDAAYCRPDPDFPPNIVIGLLGRVGMDPPPASLIMMAALKNFVGSFCAHNLTPLDPGSASFEDWIEGTPYSQRRKEELRSVWEGDPSNDPFDRKDKTVVKSFIKDEPYPEYKCPRSINSRADWFKTFSGPLFGAIGTHVFHSISEFIKTVPVRDQPDDIIRELYDLVSPVSNNDATSYEAHFKPLVMKNIEFVLYYYMCSLSQVLTEIMTKIEKVLTGNQRLRFKNVSVTVPPQRMSGEMNTSLGNGFTTLMLVLFIAWLRECRVRLRAEGDDNLSIWQSEQFVPTEKDWQQLGWVMKVERPENVCIASFCGNVFDVDDKLVIVDPVNALLNFGWVRKVYVNATDRLLLQLLRSKGLSMAYQYNGCPMLGVFGRHVVHLTKHVSMRQSIIDTMNAYDKEEFLQVTRGELPAHIEPSPSSRMLVEKLYGVTVEQQIAFERSVPDIKLWSAVEPNFCVPKIAAFNYEEYTEQPGVPWRFKLPTDFDKVEKVIRSFGPITAAFVDDYYRCDER